VSLQELDEIIAKIRYVKWGDYVLPEDHNYLLDAIKKIRDILAQVAGAVEPDYSSYSRIAMKSIDISVGISLDSVDAVVGFISRNEALIVYASLTDTGGAHYAKPVILSIPDLSIISTYPEADEYYTYYLIQLTAVTSYCSELTKKYYIIDTYTEDRRVIDVWRGKTKVASIDARDVPTDVPVESYPCISHDGKYIAVLGIQYIDSSTFRLNIALYEGQT